MQAGKTAWLAMLSTVKADSVQNGQMMLQQPVDTHDGWQAQAPGQGGAKHMCQEAQSQRNKPFISDSGSRVFHGHALHVLLSCYMQGDCPSLYSVLTSLQVCQRQASGLQDVHVQEFAAHVCIGRSALRNVCDYCDCICH